MPETVAHHLLLAALAMPLGLAAFWAFPRLRGAVGRLTPWAPVPALLLSVSATPDTSAHLNWLLLGATLGLTEITRVFLLFTAVLWLGAGIHARGYLHDDPQRPRFELLWLLTLTGNLLLILAQDVVTFYAGFALMTFAAYGLVVHSGKAEARRAGRVYLVMAVLGEGLILAGILLVVGETAAPMLPLLADLPAVIAQSARRDLLIALLFFGFGVKAGLPLLHLWLPLAHPVAPVPASAVLSGAMIKAGLIAWLHFLPIGLVSLPGWSAFAIGAGLLAAFGAAFVGLHQQQPKTVLAYSSISQMGLITVGVGMALQAPELKPLLVGAIAVYALHHALAKGALFLGVAIARHPGRRVGPLLWVLLALPALALAGVLTSGVVAKIGLKAALGSPVNFPGWWDHLPRLLELAAVGTTLILARYLWLIRSESRGDRAPLSIWFGWGLVLAAGPALVFLPAHWGLTETASATAYDWVGLGWPVLVGTLLALIGLRWLRPWPIPPGDLLALIAPGLAAIARLRIRASQATKRARSLIDPARIMFARPTGRVVRPDRIWQREVSLVFAAVLVVLLAAGLR
jgi:hydrogenase-4 component B